MPRNDFNQLSIFQNLAPDQQELLRSLFVNCEECEDTLLFEQGDPANYLYLVTEGEIHIRYKPEDGPELVVARVRPQGVVGWSAALGSPAYTSSAICASECHMLRVSGEDLRRLYTEHPETGKIVLERLAAVISERLRNTHTHVLALLEQGLRIDINNHVLSG